MLQILFSVRRRLLLPLLPFAGGGDGDGSAGGGGGGGAGFPVHCARAIVRTCV